MIRSYLVSAYHNHVLTTRMIKLYNLDYDQSKSQEYRTNLTDN